MITKVRAEQLIAEVSPDDLYDHNPVLKVRAWEDVMVLDVAKIEWPDSHLSKRVWLSVRKWEGDLGEDEFVRVVEETFQSKEYFGVCKYCTEEGRRARHLVGHMWKREACHSCATRYEGVIF